MTLNFETIPTYTLETIGAWISDARPTGGFLHAVLCNDLKEAVKRADDANIIALPLIVAYLYSYAPSACWGSPQRVADWPALVKTAKGEQKTTHSPEHQHVCDKGYPEVGEGHYWWHAPARCEAKHEARCPEHERSVHA